MCTNLRKNRVDLIL